MASKWWYNYGTEVSWSNFLFWEEWIWEGAESVSKILSLKFQKGIQIKMYRASWKSKTQKWYGLILKSLLVISWSYSLNRWALRRKIYMVDPWTMNVEVWGADCPIPLKICNFWLPQNLRSCLLLTGSLTYNMNSWLMHIFSTMKLEKSKCY